MRKIGILTFHTAINYGAILQAYALQKTLQEFSAHNVVKIINFKTDDHINRYSLFKRKHTNHVKNIILQIISLRCFFSLKQRENRFKTFIKNELHLTERYKTEDRLLNNIPDMDIYISGSDQVFNPDNIYFKAYYLAFNKGNALKIAYAPSFGISNFTKEIENKVKKYLIDFDALSCREQTGSDFLSGITNSKISTVLDPVFLLNKDQWNKLSIAPRTKSKYIFVYDLNGGKNLITIAKKIAIKTGCKIICQTQNPYRFYNVSSQLYNSGPKEFLGLISNAEYVITDSFHGTAFSIVLRKPFYTYIAMPDKSSRIRSITDVLCLNNRIIEYGESDKFEFRNSFEADDNNVLNSLITESKEYLLNSITGKY